MATLELYSGFSNQGWGAYARITYTALDGTVSLTKLEFKAQNSTTAGYGAYYDPEQSRTFTCGGVGKNTTVKFVRIKQTSYYAATLGAGTLTWTGLTGNTVTLNFTVRARSSSPNTLTFNFSIPMSYSTYTINYAANGGSSTPSAQTKTYGTNLSLANAISKSSDSLEGYTVTFNANGGSCSPSSAKSSRTKSYTFSKWQASNGILYDAGGTYIANEGTTMTAQWKDTTTNNNISTPTASWSSSSVTRKVTFNANGGTCNTSNLTSTNTTTHTAQGWYTDPSGGSQKCGNGGSYAPSQNETIYQHWNTQSTGFPNVTLPAASKANDTVYRYTNFNSTTNGGKSDPSQLTSSATRTYTWNGWYTASSGGTYKGKNGNAYAITSSADVLYAQFTGSTPATSSYSSITLPSTSRDSETVRRTVTFNANGGTCNTSSLTSTATRTYTWNGWFTAQSGGTNKGKNGATYTPDASTVTLYAQFTANNPATSAYSTITLPTATRTGYRFKGWGTSSSATTGINDTNYKPESDITLYAVWEEDSPSEVSLDITHVGRTRIRYTCSCKKVTSPSFKIKYSIDNGNTWTEENVGGSGTSRIQLLQNLTPGQRYMIKVVAINSAGTLSTESSARTATTLVDPPTNLNITASNIRYTSADINCSAVGDINGAIDENSYKIYWRKKPTKQLYDMPMKYFDNAWWVRIFYHNNKDGTVLFSTVEECKNTNSENKYSHLDLLETTEYKGSDGKFEFLLNYPVLGENNYNRWRQPKSPHQIFVGEGEKIQEYESEHIGWSGNDWGGMERNNRSTQTISDYTYIDGSVGTVNWWYALGAIQNYPLTEGIGIPGPNSQVITGPVELWVKIDNPKENDMTWGYKTVDKIDGTFNTTIDNLDPWSKYIIFMSVANDGGTSWSKPIEIETYGKKNANIMLKNGWPHNEYQKLDYIQSTGVQWIDTGINPNDYNSHLNIEADIEFTDLTGAWSNGWQTIIGAAYGDDNGTWHWNPQFHLAINTNNKFIIEYPLTDEPTTTDYHSITSDIVADKDRHRVSLLLQEKIQSLKIDGFIKEISDRTIKAQGGPNCNLYIFGRNYKYPTEQYPVAGSAAKMKLYHLTITNADNHTVLKDFYPCRRRSDNKIGLYDTINDIFHPNINNQTDFTAGHIEVWNKGNLLYKEESSWKRIDILYIKKDGHWEKAQ